MCLTNPLNTRHVGYRPGRIVCAQPAFAQRRESDVGAERPNCVKRVVTCSCAISWSLSPRVIPSSTLAKRVCEWFARISSISARDGSSRSHRSLNGSGHRAPIRRLLRGLCCCSVSELHHVAVGRPLIATRHDGRHRKRPTRRMMPAAIVAGASDTSRTLTMLSLAADATWAPAAPGANL